MVHKMRLRRFRFRFLFLDDGSRFFSVLLMRLPRNRNRQRRHSIQIFRGYCGHLHFTTHHCSADNTRTLFFPKFSALTFGEHRKAPNLTYKHNSGFEKNATSKYFSFFWGILDEIVYQTATKPNSLHYRAKSRKNVFTLMYLHTNWPHLNGGGIFVGESEVQVCFSCVQPRKELFIMFIQTKKKMGSTSIFGKQYERVMPPLYWNTLPWQLPLPVYMGNSYVRGIRKIWRTWQWVTSSKRIISSMKYSRP